jgi:hypothetical protein
VRTKAKEARRVVIVVLEMAVTEETLQEMADHRVVAMVEAQEEAKIFGVRKMISVIYGANRIQRRF